MKKNNHTRKVFGKLGLPAKLNSILTIGKITKDEHPSTDSLICLLQTNDAPAVLTELRAAIGIIFCP